MIVDYRERVNKSKNVNKKHRQGVKRSAMLIIALVAFSFGVTTGWFLFTTPGQQNIAPVATAVPAGDEAAHETVTVIEEKEKDPKLTFYDALPKGASPVIGSGINSPKKPSVAAAPNGQVVAVKVSSPKPDRPKGKYTVQVASCQSRSDAETVKGRLTSAGFQPFIVETTVEGKGTWYRVRLGKGLDPSAASAIAAKAGNGAIVIEE